MWPPSASTWVAREPEKQVPWLHQQPPPAGPSLSKHLHLDTFSLWQGAQESEVSVPRTLFSGVNDWLP